MADKTEYQLANIMKYNKDGSPDRQSTRFSTLKNVFRHLQEHRGYSRRYDLHNFGRKEVNRLVHDWKQQGLSHRTICNRMADLRWLASKVNRSHQIPKDNKTLGLRQREKPTASKAIQLQKEQLKQLPEREQLITELRAQFGLRTEEACKFQHRYATEERIGYVSLKGSWCKGGRPRQIEITSDTQRSLLERVGQFQKQQGNRSMIPAHRTFKSYYRDYYEIKDLADVAGHGLRHQWAQDRFEQIAGIKAPHAGGKPYSELNAIEQSKYDRANKIVNEELGHGAKREDITATYIGARG